MDTIEQVKALIGKELGLKPGAEMVVYHKGRMVSLDPFLLSPGTDTCVGLAREWAYITGIWSKAGFVGFFP